jgi:hypothetical protein
MSYQDWREPIFRYFAISGRCFDGAGLTFPTRLNVVSKLTGALPHVTILRVNARDFYNCFGDVLGREHEIYISARYCALRHIGLLGCVELLCDCNTTHFFDTLQRCGSVTVISRDNNGYKLTSLAGGLDPRRTRPSAR